MGGSKYYDDDPGLSIVVVYTLKPETVAAALDPTNVPQRIRAQINLLKRYNQTALKDNDARRRFKGIVFCDNWDHFNIRALSPFKGYNGKPAIVNKIGDVFQDENKCEYLEIDVKVYQTKYIARKGIDLFRERSTEAKVRIGFTLQGETEEELPENIFACCRLTNMSLDPKKIKEVDF